MHHFTDIVVLVHNNLPVTQGFVNHLFENTKNFRLIFIDNGSTDDVKSYLSEGNNKLWTLIRSEENLGIIKGRNLGASHVTAEYFINIDNDQYVGKGWLDQLHSLMQRGSFDIVGKEAWRLSPPKTGSVTINGEAHDRSYFPVHHCQRYGEQWTYIGCGGMLIKKEIYDHIGLFDERYSPAYFEDPDFNIRAIQAGYTLGWCCDCPIIHLEHQTLGGKMAFDRNKQFIRSWNEFKKKWLPFNPPLHRTLVK